MIVDAEKERIRLLLKETLTLLCKNGLPYDNKFNIEALIGITLDDNDVLLISLNEFIQGHNSVQNKPHPVTMTSVSGRKRRRPSKSSGCQNTLSSKQLHPNTVSGVQMEGLCRDQSIQDVASESESQDSDASEVDGTKKQSLSLLDKMKSVVSTAQVTKADVIVEPTSRATGSLQPMGMEESERIWKKAIAAQRVHRSPEVKVKKKNNNKSESEIQVPPAPPMCHICGITVTCEKNLTKHVRRHLGMFTYSCDECGKGYFSRPDLDAHTAATHQKIKMFQCHLCGRSYSQKRGLNKHAKQFHGKGEDVVTAEEATLPAVDGDASSTGMPQITLSELQSISRHGPSHGDSSLGSMSLPVSHDVRSHDIRSHDARSHDDVGSLGLTQSSPAHNAPQLQHQPLEQIHANIPANMSQHAPVTHLDQPRPVSHLDQSRPPHHEEILDMSSVPQLDHGPDQTHQPPLSQLHMPTSHHNLPFPQGMLHLPPGLPLTSVAHAGVPLSMPLSVPLSHGPLYQLPHRLPPPDQHQSPYH